MCVRAWACVLAQERVCWEMMLALLEPRMLQESYEVLEKWADDGTTSGVLWDFLRHAGVFRPDRLLYLARCGLLSPPQSLTDAGRWQAFVSQWLEPAAGRALAAIRLPELKKTVQTRFQPALDGLPESELRQVKAALGSLERALQRRPGLENAVLAAKYALMLRCKDDKKRKRRCDCPCWERKERHAVKGFHCRPPLFKLKTALRLLRPDVLNQSYTLLENSECGEGAAIRVLAGFLSDCMALELSSLCQELEAGWTVRPPGLHELGREVHVGLKAEQSDGAWAKLCSLLSPPSKGSVGHARGPLRPLQDAGIALNRGQPHGDADDCSLML